jgi:hypothetical protein
MAALASSLTLYSSTGLGEALRLTPSVVEGFFAGKPFKDWSKNRDNELKAQAAIVDRLNSVIKACGYVAKAIARTARGR